MSTNWRHTIDDRGGGGEGGAVPATRALRLECAGRLIIHYAGNLDILQGLLERLGCDVA